MCLLLKTVDINLIKIVDLALCSLIIGAFRLKNKRAVPLRPQISLGNFHFTIDYKPKRQITKEMALHIKRNMHEWSANNLLHGR